MARRARRPRFHGPAADSALGEAFLDAIGIVAALGFAADVSQCVQLCGATFRAGDRGATNDMLAQSLRLQCGAREAHAAGREQIRIRFPLGGTAVMLDSTLDSSTQLIRAAILNDLPRMLQLIQLGAPLDLVDEAWGRSALHWACELGHVHVAKALLDGKYEVRGAAVDLRDKCGWTALTVASSNGNEAIVRLLLSRGAKQGLLDNGGCTALHRAVGSNHAGVVALLCAAPGATSALAVKSTGFESRTPLAQAIADGRTLCEAVLREHGAKE
jgi:ankyrin repeat protein